MTTQTLLNGVPVDQLVDTMRAVRREPEIAKFTFRVENRWHGGGHNRARADAFDGAGESHRRPQPFEIEMDEPPVLLGGDRGANPVEALLAALSGCLTTSLVYHAAARGITIHEVESTYEGHLDLHGFLGMDDTIRNGFDKIHVQFRVDGDASEAELDEIVQIARERSPVFDMVTRPVDVTVSRVNSL